MSEALPPLDYATKTCVCCGPRFHELVAFIEGEWRCIDRDDCAEARASKGIREGSKERFKGDGPQGEA